MRPAHLGRLNVDQSVALQRPVIGVVQRAGKQDPVAAMTVQFLDEILCVEPFANHDQWRLLTVDR